MVDLLTKTQARSSKWGCILVFSAHSFRKSEVSLGYILRLHISGIFLIDVTKHPTNQLKGEDLFWFNIGEGTVHYGGVLCGEGVVHCGGALCGEGAVHCGGVLWPDRESRLLTLYQSGSNRSEHTCSTLCFLFLRGLYSPDDVTHILFWSFLLS